MDFLGHIGPKNLVPQESVVAETLTEIAIELSFVFNVQPTFWRLTRERFAHHLDVKTSSIDLNSELQSNVHYNILNKELKIVL